MEGFHSLLKKHQIAIDSRYPIDRSLISPAGLGRVVCTSLALRNANNALLELGCQDLVLRTYSENNFYGGIS